MLTVGDKFPALTVPVQQGSALPAGETINLGDSNGKWKIVFFWPKDFTFVCPTEIIGYGELLQDFADRDAQLIGVLAQRLLRRLCPACAQPAATGELARLLPEGTAAEKGSVKAAAGCAACRQTGYQGRRGIFELLLVDDGIRRHIQARATAAEINAAARAAGMRSLRDDGAAKVLAGLTTVDEVLRVTMRSTL